jgi:GDP-4-dehydro-6-deoxy-D-mannose reductase
VSRSSFRVFITGGNGFVGRYLSRALARLPECPEIVVGTLDAGAFSRDVHVRKVELDVTNANDVHTVIATEQPTHLFHLAAIAAVPEAQGNTRKTWAVNFGGVLNVAIAISEAAPECRLLCCTSAEIYGGSFLAGKPLDETSLLDPINSYAASKAAADLMVGQMAKQGLRAIRLRPFNHTGVGQKELFVVPALASQIARIERGEQEPVIHVGQLTNRRDFLDVRDVVDAYVRAILRFDQLPAGSAINIASGHTIAIGEILDFLLSLSCKKIEVVQDRARMRGSDMPETVGNGELARRLLDWKPRIDIYATLASVLDSYRAA